MGGSEGRTTEGRVVQDRSSGLIARTSDAATRPQVLNCGTLRPTTASVCKAPQRFLDPTYVKSSQYDSVENHENRLIIRIRTWKSPQRDEGFLHDQLRNFVPPKLYLEQDSS